jgi:1,4-alpha-glucan branching enzyme
MKAERHAFAVWAPNAYRVSVVGAFNNGTGVMPCAIITIAA